MPRPMSKGKLPLHSWRPPFPQIPYGLHLNFKAQIPIYMFTSTQWIGTWLVCHSQRDTMNKNIESIWKLRTWEIPHYRWGDNFLDSFEMACKSSIPRLVVNSILGNWEEDISMWTNWEDETHMFGITYGTIPPTIFPLHWGGWVPFNTSRAWGRAPAMYKVGFRRSICTCSDELS